MPIYEYVKILYSKLYDVCMTLHHKWSSSKTYVVGFLEPTTFRA